MHQKWEILDTHSFLSPVHVDSMKRSFLLILLAHWLGAAQLFSQANYFCQSAVESSDCVLPGKCMGVHLPCEIEKRYSLSPVNWHSTFNFGTITEGQNSCDPTFFFDIKKSSDDFANTLNSERTAHSDCPTRSLRRDLSAGIGGSTGESAVVSGEGAAAVEDLVGFQNLQLIHIFCVRFSLYFLKKTPTQKPPALQN